MRIGISFTSRNAVLIAIPLVVYLLLFKQYGININELSFYLKLKHYDSSFLQSWFKLSLLKSYEIPSEADIKLRSEKYGITNIFKEFKEFKVLTKDKEVTEQLILIAYLFFYSNIL